MCGNGDAAEVLVRAAIRPQIWRIARDRTTGVACYMRLHPSQYWRPIVAAPASLTTDRMVTKEGVALLSPEDPRPCDDHFQFSCF